MKLSVKFILVIAFILSALNSCDFILDIFPNGKSVLTFKASLSSKNNPADTVLFTGNDIKWFNGTTGEVRFVDSLTIPNVSSFHRIKCYLGSDSLFMAAMTSNVMSSMVNDLVLNHNLRDGKYYFKDGYPENTTNSGANGARLQNKEKRTASWSRFLEQLKNEGRFIEK